MVNPLRLVLGAWARGRESPVLGPWELWESRSDFQEPVEFRRNSKRLWIPFCGIHMSGRLGSFHGAKHEPRIQSPANHNMLGVPTQNPEEPHL